MASWGSRLLAALVGGGAAVLVLYPIAFLIQASLSVGDPQARPPEAYGLANFAELPRYSRISCSVWLQTYAFCFSMSCSA